MLSDCEIRDPREVPTAWFAVLEDARRNGDREREREARRNLKRLGVKVTFRRPGMEAAHV